METEKQRMEFQLELLNEILDSRLRRTEIRARRDYFKSELSKLQLKINK